VAIPLIQQVCFLWRLLAAPLNSAGVLSKGLLRLQDTRQCGLQARNDGFVVLGVGLFVGLCVGIIFV
jgi:hypothetical protein